jgi:hypothetical protein
VVTEGGDAATLARGVADARGGPGWRAGTVGLMSGDVSTRSSDVNEPQINVDHFYHRPTYHVVGARGNQRHEGLVSIASLVA